MRHGDVTKLVTFGQLDLVPVGVLDKGYLVGAAFAHRLRWGGEFDTFFHQDLAQPHHIGHAKRHMAVGIAVAEIVGLVMFLDDLERVIAVFVAIPDIGDGLATVVINTKGR